MGPKRSQLQTAGTTSAEPEAAKLRRRLEACEAAKEAAQAAATAARAQAAEAEAEVERCKLGLLEEVLEHGQSQRLLAMARALAEARERENAELRAEVSALRDRATHAGVVASKRQEKWAESEQELAAARYEAERLRKVLEQRNRQVETLRADAAAREAAAAAQADASEQTVHQLRLVIGDLKQEVTELRRRCDATKESTRRQMEQSEQFETCLIDVLADTKGEVERLTAECKAAAETIAQQADALEALRAQLHKPHSADAAKASSPAVASLESRLAHSTAAEGLARPTITKGKLAAPRCSSAGAAPALQRMWRAVQHLTAAGPAGPAAAPPTPPQPAPAPKTAMRGWEPRSTASELPLSGARLAAPPHAGDTASSAHGASAPRPQVSSAVVAAPPCPASPASAPIERTRLHCSVSLPAPASAAASGPSSSILCSSDGESNNSSGFLVLPSAAFLSPPSSPAYSRA